VKRALVCLSYLTFDDRQHFDCGLVVQRSHALMSSSQLAIAWILAALTAVLVLVLSRWQSVKQKTAESRQRRFHVKDLILQFTDPNNPKRVAQVCAEHRSARCKLCGVDFVASNASMPNHHTVCCCIRRQGLPASSVVIVDRKTGRKVVDDDLVDGVVSRDETAATATRCPVQ
jgi:hypothetical protein